MGLRGVTGWAVIGLLALPARGLDPQRSLSQYAFDDWTVEHGLPQDRVNAVAQTADGYLWLGTMEGLARFDGESFASLGRHNTPGLADNRVRALVRDAADDLWIGTEAGLCRQRRRGFECWGARDGLAAGVVWALAPDGRGGVWVGTDGGLSRFKDGRFTTWRRADGLPSDRVQALALAPDGALWVGTADAGLARFREGSFEIFGRAQGLVQREISALLVDRAGTLWVGGLDGSLERLERGAFRPVWARHGAFRVNALVEDREGSVWVGGPGLARVRGERVDLPPAGHPLAQSQVMGLFEDREGSLWCGTYGAGLARLRDARFVGVTVADGLSSSYVKSVTVAPDGRVFVGTYGGGLNVIEDGRVKVVDVARGLPANEVRSVLVDREGAAWVGTTNGLARLEGERVRTWGTGDGLPGSTVHSLQLGPDGTVWIGTNGGLARWSGGRLTPWGQAEGLPQAQVGPVLVARDGAVWVGTYGAGLVRLRDGQATRFGEREGLLGQTVLALHQDSRGTLWVGSSDGGLARLTGERFLSFTTRDGLHDDGVFSILEDRQGQLWLPGNHGISRVSPADIERFTRGELPAIPSVVYGTADGMPGRQCSGGSLPNAWQGPDGRLWFATSQGLALLDPARTPPVAQAPPVVIASARIEGRTFSPPLPTGVVLGPGEGRLEFRYAALTFLATERVRYRYKLEGFDRDWVEAGRRRDAYYTNIPAGQYAFRVVAASGDGLWNDVGATFALELRPRAWERRSVQALLAGGVLLLGLLLHRARVWRLEARDRELRQLVEERTARLREEVARSEQALHEGERARLGLERANLQLERANLQLRSLSYVDDLTGLANRRHFNALLDEEWRRAARAGTWVALVLIDVDHFKELNDTLGHDQGDRCLVQLGQVLVEGLRRAGDVVARYGGEEFAVLIPGAQVVQAAVLAEQLRRRVEELGLRQPGSPGLAVTISAGAAACQPRAGESPEQLIKAADEALYAAKRAGRNRVSSADAPPEPPPGA